MHQTQYGWRVALTVIALSVAGIARADWLAADPGTKISLQLNSDHVLVFRPVGGTWTHPTCPDVTAVALNYLTRSSQYAEFREYLVEAAMHGSIVNIFAGTDECDERGRPIIRNIRVQGP